MKHLSIRLVVALVTLAIGFFSDRATNRAVDYLWPDAVLPELERVTIVTVNPNGISTPLSSVGGTNQDVTLHIATHRTKLPSVNH